MWRDNAKTRLRLNARLVFNLLYNEMGSNFDLEIGSVSMGAFGPAWEEYAVEHGCRGVCHKY